MGKVKNKSSLPSSVLRKTKKTSIEIDRRLCKRCGICVQFCPRKVFELGEDLFPKVVNLEACNRCKLCELHCPDFAIDVETEDEISVR